MNIPLLELNPLKIILVFVVFARRIEGMVKSVLLLSTVF
jgi:hypothetical protein